MIMQCACCQMNSVGMHECNCPMNPNNINQLPVVISGGYVPQDLVDKEYFVADGVIGACLGI